MSIYAECPRCHRKQSLTNEKCRSCKTDLKSARKKNLVPYWVYLRYKDRQQLWKRIGENLTIARDEEAKLRAQLVEDEFKIGSSRIKLNDFWLKLYLPWIKTEKKTWEKDEERYDIHLKKVFGDKFLSSITEEMIEEYKEARKLEKIRVGKRPTRPATINRELALLKTIFNRAIKLRKFKGANPVSLAGMLKEKNRHIAKALTGEQFKKLMEHLPAETKPIIEFCLATGIRSGNVLTLRWDQVDEPHKVVHIPEQKGGVPLDLPLSDWALKILRSIPRHMKSPYVFCHLTGKDSGEPFKIIRGGFQDACQKAGLPKFRVHDLRHTFGSWLAASGVPTALIRDLMGHSTIAMTGRYMHTGQPILREAANKIENPADLSDIIENPSSSRDEQ